MTVWIHIKKLWIFWTQISFCSCHDALQSKTLSLSAVYWGLESTDKLQTYVILSLAALHIIFTRQDQIAAE